VDVERFHGYRTFEVVASNVLIPPLQAEGKQLYKERDLNINSELKVFHGIANVPRAGLVARTQSCKSLQVFGTGFEYALREALLHG
jgi:hypothetical protein